MTVTSDEQLKALYNKLAEGGSPVSTPRYDGSWVEFPDGWSVGLRDISRSGGRTIDIRSPDGSEVKGARSAMNQTEVIDDVIQNGVSDWVMDSEVVAAIRQGTPEDDPLAVRKQLLDIVTAIVSRGLAELGDTPPGEGGFRPWGLPLDEALARIITRWDAMPEAYTIAGELFWLCNTPLGDEEGERVLDRWEAEGLL